jgi:hypothetical protein
MLLEGRPKRYYIFCVVQERPSQCEIAFDDSGRIVHELLSYFFAWLLKICNGTADARPIRSACELRMYGVRAKATWTQVAFLEVQSMRS